MANKEVVLDSKLTVGGKSVYSWTFYNMTDTVLKTDSQGYVTFVFGRDKYVEDGEGGRVIDATSTDYVARYKLTASVVGNKDISATTDINFAAIDVNTITGVAPKTGDTYKYDSVTTNKSAANTTVVSKADTHDRNGNAVTYITSRQVSDANTNHAVTFESNVSELALVLPTSSSSTTEPEKLNETIDFDSKEYSTYADVEWGKVIDSIQASKLQYATVHFSKLSLSKYSRFIVRAFVVDDKDNPTKKDGYTEINLSTNESQIAGEKVASDFSVQIPLNDVKSGYLYVTAQIESKGQVNTDVNDGFIVKKIVGVQNGSTSSTAKLDKKALEGITVTWEKDTDVTYTISKSLPAGAVKTYLEGKYKDCTFEYKVPAFPRTGNAIITVYDNANKVVDYYAIPTQNDFVTNKDGTVTYKNQNVIVDDTSKLYVIGDEEALNIVGDVKASTADSNLAIVDSQKTGVTHIIGTITSTNPNVKIDPSNDNIYTSVNWNPIPKTSNDDKNKKPRQAAGALVGQNITIKAQLVDTNGNIVKAQEGVALQFYYGEDVKLEAGKVYDDVSVIKADTATNTSGQAELTLVAGKPAQLLGIYAKTSDGVKYDLNYVLGKTKVAAELVDAYWFDANLLFEPNASTTEKAKTEYDNPVKDTKNEFKIEPTVGSHWTYEVRVIGDLADIKLGGSLEKATSVSVSGLTIQTSKGSSSEAGDVTDASNGKANVTSTKAGTTKLINVLDKNSITSTSDIKFTFEGNNTEVLYAGEGTTSLDKKLTLSIDWNAGVPTAEIIIPTSKKAPVTSTGVKVYVVVKDASGNPLEKKTVNLTNAGAGTLNKVTATTNKDGVAEFTVTPDANTPAGKSAELVAKVDGLNTSYTSSIKWITAPVDEFKVIEAAYDPTAQTVKLTFNNDIYSDSVIKEQFTLKYNGIEQLLADATVSGNTVTLSLPRLNTVDAVTPFEVSIKPEIKDSIEYGFVSVDAQSLASTSVAFLANGTLGTVTQVADGTNTFTPAE